MVTLLNNNNNRFNVEKKQAILKIDKSDHCLSSSIKTPAQKWRFDWITI